MKPLRLLLALLLTGCAASAQRVYFIYLQTDDRAPFSVKLADKVHSSSATGFVILPNLVDSNYQLGVSFPGSGSEHRFEVKVDKADRGFVLKQVGGTWNLFDLQQLTLQKALAASGPSEEDNRSLLAVADPFTRLLVQASDDPTLLYGGAGPSAPRAESVAAAQPPVSPKTEPSFAAAKVPAAPVQKPVLQDTIPLSNNTTARAVSDTTIEIGGDDPAPPAAPASTVTNLATNTGTPPVTTPALPAEPVYRKSVVTRRSESSTTEGFGLVFHDVQDGQTDTIRILIPNPKTAPAPPPVPVAAASDSTKALVAPAGTATAAGSSVPDSTQSASPAAVAKKTDCKAEADEKDLLKLRRNMVAASDEGSMVAAARKGFRNACYTTEQVRHLGALFFTDLGKYNLYEAAWGHVSDPGNFAALGNELRDSYFINRLQQLSRK